MTKAETLQSGRDLIAIEIHGFKLHTPTFMIHYNPPYWEGHVGCVIPYHAFKPDLNTEQSLAVKKRLKDLEILTTVSTDVTTCCTVRDVSSIRSGNWHYSDSDKDELMAIFKACVKASEWIRDNQSKDEKNG